MSEIIIAPFSNGDIRDWQPEHFSALIGILVDRWDGMVRVVGTRSQATRAAAIVRPHDATRVISECGRLAWEDVVAAIRGAACVIGNNSGLTHLSAWFGVPTICVFGGSHRPAEWRPMGFSARTISSAIGCAPRPRHRARDCPDGKACLDRIEPHLVADAALAAMASAEAGEAAHGA